LAREQLAGMRPLVQLALSDFMDAVVIVDPAEYHRRPDEPERPLRTLPFGEVGLVTFFGVRARRSRAGHAGHLDRLTWRQPVPGSGQRTPSVVAGNFIGP